MTTPIANHIAALTPLVRAAVGELLHIMELALSSKNQAIRAFGGLLSLRVQKLVLGKAGPVSYSSDHIQEVLDLAKQLRVRKCPDKKRTRRP